MIDINAPIIPWESLGGVKLYSHLKEFYEYIFKSRPKVLLIGMFDVRYEIENQAYLWFSMLNGQLWKITALKNYKGKLFDKINIGMHIDEVLKIEPSFKYDDFEEVYCSPKGIYIETDPITHNVLWISVYVKEIDTKDFEKGNW